MAQALTGQLVVQGVNSTGGLTYVSGVQNAGVLDDLFYYPGKLGPVFDHGQLTINLWAPTAQSVKLLLYNGENDTTPAQTLPMKQTNGVWSIEEPNSWKGQYYLYDIFVLCSRSAADRRKHRQRSILIGHRAQWSKDAHHRPQR